MQSSSIPAKYLVPFAQNDAAKVEIPVTTADTTRASQSLGFPPRTMLPPEASGVPPQGEDFNGAMNQVARAAWWLLQGNAFPFDATFSADSNIGGYAKGAYLPLAAYTGYMLSLAENNTVSPDTATASGTNDALWAPGYNYGATTIAGLAGTNVTLTLAQAAKDTLILTGTLSASIQLIAPAWVKSWYVQNNVTMGAFTLTMKTTSGTGVSLAAGAQRVRGDGTNIVQIAESVAAASTSTQSPQFGQLPAVVGTARNPKMIVGAASATATLSADEIVVETALGGLAYRVANFSKTINLATTGAGGMDTGVAPNNGFVALYAIYNPTTQVSALLAVNATAGVVSEVYGGANMPAGYTASALVAVVPTNGSGQIQPCGVSGRTVTRQQSTALSSASAQGSLTSLSLGNVPFNARSAFVQLGMSNATNPSGFTFGVAPDAAGTGAAYTAQYAGAGVGVNAAYEVPIFTPQTIWYQNSASAAGTLTFTIYLYRYTF